jgi:hypothetical protein
MKKIVLFASVLLTAFVLPLFALSGYDGGPARLQAMGGQQVVVADESATLDLYGAGFDSAIFTRPAVSFISLYPEIDIYTSGSESASGAKDSETVAGGGTGSSFASNDGIQLFLSPGSVLVVKPMISAFGGRENRSPGNPSSINYFDILPGAEISYAQKLGPGFAVSVTGGYLRQDSSGSDPDSSGFEDYMDKIEYELSLTWLPEKANGWAYSLSAGNKTSMFIMPLAGYDFNSSINDFTMGMGSYSLFNGHLYNKYEYTLTTEEDYSDTFVTGEKFNFGGSSPASNDSQFEFSIGGITGLSITEKTKRVVTTKSTGAKVTTNYPDNKDLSNGFGLDCEAGFRTTIGGAAIGFKADDTFIGGDIEGGTMGTNIINITAGPVFGNKGFLVPVELFYGLYSSDSTFQPNENTSLTYDAGVRVGNEIALGETTYLRYGIDFSAVGGTYSNETNGIVTMSSGPVGSAGNPWMMQMGYNAGMGFTGKSHELNIGVRVEPQWSQPKDDYYKSDSMVNVKIYSDLKIFL